jgi:hypothetical protein
MHEHDRTIAGAPHAETQAHAVASRQDVIPAYGRAQRRSIEAENSGTASLSSENESP